MTRTLANRRMLSNTASRRSTDDCDQATIGEKRAAGKGYLPKHKYTCEYVGVFRFSTRPDPYCNTLLLWNTVIIPRSPVSYRGEVPSVTL